MIETVKILRGLLEQTMMACSWELPGTEREATVQTQARPRLNVRANVFLQ